jgi:DNA-binding LacI/PurR family transcriptional regulator
MSVEPGPKGAAAPERPRKPARKVALSRSAPLPDPEVRQRPQMADIARLAGVSVATVSRALNGSEEISQSTRERIGALARSLNYTINVGAKNLRTKRNRTVAVVIPYDRQSRQHVSDPFFLAMLGSLADALTDSGFDLLLSRVDADRLESAGQLYESGVACGVILIGQWHHPEQLDRLAARRVPLVVWGAEMPQQGYCSVGGDNISGGLLATRHLLARGCQRIVFMGDPSLPEVAQRLVGHQQALGDAGRAADPALLLAVPFDSRQASAGLEALLRSGVRPDAVFACSDVLAMSAIQTLRSHHMSVPADVAVVGYDDIAWAAYADPPLTTVHQPIAEAGAAIVEALLAVVAGESVRSLTLPVRLVERASSAR